MRDKSKENWDVGLECLGKGNFNAAANRLYYGVFQAVLMYAVNKQGFPRTQVVGSHAKMGKIVGSIGMQRELCGKQFTRLMMLREMADYRKETPDRAAIEKLIDSANKTREYFIKLAEK